MRTIKKIRLFFFNAAMLACVNVLIRAASVAFNSYVSAKVGAEGMGLLTLVMSVYGLAVTVAASGVNLAAVRLTAQALAQSESENFVHGRNRMRSVVRGCILYSLLFGIFASLTLFAFSGWIGRTLLCDTRTIPSLRVLALSLPAISLSSALAGYFTGVRRVYKNAAVAVLEQLVKIMLTSAALLLLAPAGIEYACLAVVGGSAVAEAASLVSAALLYLFDNPARKKATVRREKPPVPAFKKVFFTAFPVAVGAYARQGLVSAEHLAIPWGLKQSGASAAEALASYGVLHGMVYPLIFFPSAVLSAFSGLLVPEFTACCETGNFEKIRSMATKVIRTSLLFSVGVSGIFISFAYDIGTGMYPGTNAAALLALIAPLIPVMYLDSSVDSMLKGMGEQVYCMKVNIADSLSCLLLVVILLPHLGMTGYFLVQYTCELINASLSISRLLSVTGLRANTLKWVFKPILSIILSTAAVRFLAAYPRIPLIGAGGSAAARIAVAVVLYCILAVATGAVSKEDARWAASVIHR